MVRNILIGLLLLHTLSVGAFNKPEQTEEQKQARFIGGTMNKNKVTGFTHPGLFLFRASLAVGGMTAIKVSNVFIEGNTEYFIDRRVSLRGDGYFFATSYSDLKPFKMHHSLFTGAMFHKMTNGDFDPYAGLEMGINYAQAIDPYLGGTGSIAITPPEATTKVFSPTLSPVIGFNYYGGKFFHITMHARYIMGRFMDNYNSVSLGEWRISFGLGFNLSRKLLNMEDEKQAKF